MMEEHVSDLTENSGPMMFGYKPDMTGQVLLSSLSIDLPRMLGEL